MFTNPQEKCKIYNTEPLSAPFSWRNRGRVSNMGGEINTQGCYGLFHFQKQ